MFSFLYRNITGDFYVDTGTRGTHSHRTRKVTKAKYLPQIRVGGGGWYSLVRLTFTIVYITKTQLFLGSFCF